MRKESGVVGIIELLIPALVLLGIFVIGVVSARAESPTAGLYNADGKIITPFSNVKANSSIAVGDIDKDGEDEIIIGSAPGEEPAVSIYEKNAKLIRTIKPYGSGMIAGINVAVGDLTGYGNVEIVVAPRRGAGPHVLRYDPSGKLMSPGFFAFSPRFHGGVNLAIGDVNGDGLNEIIAGAGPGSTHVAYFEHDGTHIGNAFPFQEANGRPAPYGVVVGAIDVDNDGMDEVIAAPQQNHEADVKVIKWREITKTFRAYGNFKGGVSLSTNNSGGGARVLLGAGFGGGPHVTQYNLATGNLDTVNSFPFDASWRQGVTVAFFDYNDTVEYFAIPGSLFTPTIIDEAGKSVIVDLSEQRLYAYENGRQVNTFLVSTGLPGMDTRTGRFSITQKIYSHLYSGPGYYLPNTLYNMRFDGPRLLHGAYWHNDFGRRKSHGCVNIAYPNAEWLYNWASVGTTVIVQQ